jgi:sugar phosphate isomerase/epimerase
MKQEYSLAHLTVLGCPPPEMIYIARMTGYDYASLRPIYMRLPGEPNYDLAHNPEMLRQTKQAISDTGIRIHDIELARITDDIDVSEYEPAMEVGAELGARSLLSSIWTNDKSRYMEQFSKLVELAGKYNLNVDLEFVTWASVWDIDGVKEVLLAQHAKNIGMMIDMLHFYRSKMNISQLDGLPKEWFHFVHLNDAPEEIPDRHDVEALAYTGRNARLYPGEGYAPIAEIMKKLPPVVCSVELPNTARAKVLGFAEHARRCLETSKRYFEQHGLN